MRFRFSFVFWLLGCFVTAQTSESSGNVFEPGELLQYKLSFGWVTVGRGAFEISPEPKFHQGQACFQISAAGRSTGLLRWVAPVADEWGSIIRQSDLAPLHSFRNIKEGRYQLNEQVFVDPDMGKLRVESIKPHRKQQQRPERNYRFDPAVALNDLLSGLLHIRNHDFNRMNPGDTLELKVFYEDTFYDIQVVFAAREELKTNFGRLSALRVIPLMPENAVFDGKQALTAWFSDDRNKLPLKVSAKMFVGKVSAELVSYQNIKYELGSKE